MTAAKDYRSVVLVAMPNAYMYTTCWYDRFGIPTQYSHTKLNWELC